MRKGLFIVISGPSGVGKDTIADILIDRINGVYSISMTTRKPRINEKDGEDYFFVEREEFERNIKDDNFFEYAIYNNNYYGTLKEFVFSRLDKGIDVISVIDIQGGMKIEEIFPEALLFFILPPSFEELENRLRKRNTDSEEEIKKRLLIAEKEIKYKDKYDYVVINDNIEKTVEEITSIIDKEKLGI